MIALKPDGRDQQIASNDLDFGSLPPTGAAIDPCGRPDLKADSETAVLLWKNCSRGIWFLAATGGGSRSLLTFEGTVSSDRPASLVEGVAVERDDTIDRSDPKALAFALNVAGTGKDMLKFAFPSDASVCVDLVSAGQEILVGPMRVPVASSVDLSTMRGCSAARVTLCGAPPLNKEATAAASLWKDCGKDQWILVATGGGGNFQRYEGQIRSDKAASFYMGKALEKNVVLVSSTPTSIDFKINVGGPGKDEIRFAFPQATEICVDVARPGKPLLIGSDQTPMASPINLVTMGACTTNANALSVVGSEPASPPAEPPPAAPTADVSTATETCLHGYLETAAPDQPPIPGTWTPTFEENFDSAVLDGTKWKVGTHWYGTNGLANNVPENIAVDCGFLEMVAKREDTKLGAKAFDYTMGKVSSFKRFRQLYGYYETRIRYDAVQGAWPAFWMMPDRGYYGSIHKNRVSYLKFDLGKAGTKPVKQAHLELVVESLGASAQSLSVHHVPDDNWREMTINWENRPTPDPRWQARVHESHWSVGEAVRLDVTAAVNAALQGDRQLTLAIADTFMSAKPVSFFSGEAAKATNHPRIRLAGMAQPIIVTEDATVGEGRSATTNFGDQPSLEVMEAWSKAASTLDGGMEFDIMESLGHWGPTATSHALHWDGYEGNHKRTGSGYMFLEPSPDGFHTYGMNWQEGLVEFYIDGKKTYEERGDCIGSVEAFLILGMQVGGWADDLGNARDVDDDGLPASMHVDYVKVWKGKSR